MEHHKETKVRELQPHTTWAALTGIMLDERGGQTQNHSSWRVCFMDSSRTANLISGFGSQGNSYCGKERGPLQGAVRRASGSGGFPVRVTWQEVQALPPTCALLCAPVWPRRWDLSPLSLDQLSFHPGLDGKYDSHPVCIHLKVSQGQSPVSWGWPPGAVRVVGFSVWPVAISCSRRPSVFPRTRGLDLCSASPRACVPSAGRPS